MANQVKIESVLVNPRWSSRTLSSKDSEIKVHLISFPGVVGGVFRAQITGLTADLFGDVDVSITCTGYDSDYVIGEPGATSYGIDFQENTTLLIEDFSFEISFRIPFEAQATEEGSDWHLLLNFSNDISEVFEIPVCRTLESNPEMTSVAIAAQVPIQQKHQHKLSHQTSNKSRIKPYTMSNYDGELNFQFPAYTPGRKPVLAQGLGVFAGIWAVMYVSVLWFSKAPQLDFIFIFGGVLLVMLIVVIFLLFGVSYCKISKEKITIKHKLFGQPLNWAKANRSDLAGFTILSLGVTPGQKRSQSNYLIVAKTKGNSSRFLCVTVFDQDEARLLVKQLNEYWGIGK